MEIKKTLLILSALTTISATVIANQAYAYSIFNKTPHSVRIKDRAGLSGIDATIPPNGSTSCSPNSKGCYGKIKFTVYAPQGDENEICSWTGKLKKGRGNYFVITPVAGVSYPNNGSCFLEYYHD